MNEATHDTRRFKVIFQGVQEHEEVERKDCYREKYVAFIDMLGFGQRVKASAHDPVERKAIIEAIEHLRSTATPNPHVGLLITYFSDCIVISADETPRGLFCLFQAITFIADNLIQRDVLIRGGIAHGGMYHDDDLCFGPAMVAAYELESVHADVPRILFDKRVESDADAYGFSPVWIIFDDKDPKQWRHLNYLLHYTAYDAVPRVGGLVQTEPAMLIRHYIAKRLVSPNEKVRAKGEWMRQYWDELVAINGVLPAIDIETDIEKPDAMPSKIKLYMMASK